MRLFLLQPPYPLLLFWVLLIFQSLFLTLNNIIIKGLYLT